MNPTIIIRPPCKGRPYWLGTAMTLNEMQSVHLGGWTLPLLRVERGGIDRNEIAERIASVWPEPKL